MLEINNLRKNFNNGTHALKGVSFKIKKAVLEAHKYGAIGGYGGEMSHYIEMKDSDYDVLRDVVKLLKKNKS